ncbi:MAG TPA: DUF58 domain-containing protein [Anaerolineales bacterium]|nr:DUF58 domain-containing protein [Anaerolineales bacterium]
MRLTWRGLWLLLLPAPLMAGGAWIPGLQWAAAGLFVMGAGLITFDWRLAQGISRFQITRRHEKRLSLGADNAIAVEVYNRSRRGATIWLRDEAPEEFVVEPLVLSGECGPFRAWRATYHVRPPRRGDYHFGKTNLRWLGPLRLIIRHGAILQSDSVKVYPNLLDARRFDLLVRQNRLREMGLHQSRIIGEGTEFERLREYLPDDEFRRINWKATARRNRPITVQYQTERSQNIVLALDTGRMMQSPVAHMAKLDYAVNAMLLLAYVATGKGDKVGWMAFADRVDHYAGPRQGRGQFYRMLEMLYRVEPQPVEPDYHHALSYLALRQRKRSLIVIFTDLSGGLSMDALVARASLLAEKNLPLVVTIRDPEIDAVARRRPQDSASVYQRAAAEQLLDERKVALDRLRQRGVPSLDVAAGQLSGAVIERYLELKARSRL